MATILAGALMLDTLGHPESAGRIDAAVQRVIADGPTTPDLGGSASTLDVAHAIEQAVDG